MLVHRYILREHLSPYLLALAAILFLLFVNLILELVDQIIGKGVPGGAALEVFMLNLAWMVALAVPMAVLVAVLMAFGRLSGDGEISAIKSAGISLHRAAWPVLLCGVVLSIAVALFNDLILPDANHRARMLMDDIRRKKPAVAFADKPGLVIDDFDSYRILVGSIDPHDQSMEDIIIYKQLPGEFPTAILAARGEISLTYDQKDMVLMLYEGEVHAVDSQDPSSYIRTFFDRQLIRLGDSGRHLLRTAQDTRGDREMSVAAMRSRASSHAAEARRIEKKVADVFEAFVRGSLLSGSQYPHGSLKDLKKTIGQIRSELMVHRYRERAVNRYLVEIHKKFAIPVACIVFIFVGFPLGIRLKTDGAARGGAASIGFFLVYWLCLIGGEKLADRGYLSPGISMWAANILIGFVGGYLTWRVLKT